MGFANSHFIWFNNGQEQDVGSYAECQIVPAHYMEQTKSTLEGKG